MTTTTVRNGVEVDHLVGTIESITGQPELGAFTFRAQSSWVDGTHNVGRISGFIHAGEEDESRAAPFVLDGAEPSVLLGANNGRNAVVLQALAFCYEVGCAANAAARGIEISRMDYAIEGDLDVRPFLGLEGRWQGRRGVAGAAGGVPHRGRRAAGDRSGRDHGRPDDTR
jgi:hypothetical protein